MIALTIKAKAEANVRAFISEVDEKYPHLVKIERRPSIDLEALAESRVRVMIEKYRHCEPDHRFVSKGHTLERARAVRSDRGERWASFTKAAEALGVHSSLVGRSIEKGWLVNGRLLWVEGTKKPTVTTRRNGKAIIDEAGKVHASIAQLLIALHGEKYRYRQRVALERCIRNGLAYLGKHYMVYEAKAVSQ